MLPTTLTLSKDPFQNIDIAIVDSCVLSQYGDQISGRIIPVAGGEEAKSIDTACDLWHQLSKLGVSKHETITAIGGGAISDLVGFVASTYMRGIATRYIPTTLLSQVDACFGGKTAINFAGIKNLIGTLHHPREVVISAHFLLSISEREYRSGVAEIIKYACLEDTVNQLLEKKSALISRDLQVVEKIVIDSLRAKERIIEKKARDTLNWGHTIGHAIEAMTDLTHGEAISIGMNYEARLSVSLGLASPDFQQQIESLITSFGLPVVLPDVDIDKLISLIQSDKKRTEKGIACCVAAGFGSIYLMQGIDSDLIRKTMCHKI